MTNPFAAILFRCRQWAEPYRRVKAEVERRRIDAFLANPERDPWVREYHRVRAEVERTGDTTLFEDFERRFQQWKAECWPFIREP
jgi:hypothetical protein